MRPSNTIVQDSASLRQAFAAIGILVALAIVVPIAGILMIPAVALGTVGRAFVEAAAEARASRERDAAPARPTPDLRRPAARPLAVS